MHTDRTIVLHGQRFHYTEWGPPAAPPVIFLHGITGHARTWDDEARLLAERCHVIYGGSVKPDNIRELIAEPDVDGALVGGASLELKTFVEIITKSGAAAV